MKYAVPMLVVSSQDVQHLPDSGLKRVRLKSFPGLSGGASEVTLTAVIDDSDGEISKHGLVTVTIEAPGSLDVAKKEARQHGSEAKQPEAKSAALEG